MNKNYFYKILPLIIAIICFVSCGSYHIAQSETTDEHFWKYDRIQKYYHGLHDGLHQNNWKKTRINDKPGVTVALISGIGLPFAPDPQTHRDTAQENATRYTNAKTGKSVKLYDIFHTEKTTRINTALRMPIVLFNGLIALPLLFYLLWQAFSPRIAGIAIVLIGCNPILIGISRIINPDALLWSTTGIALIAFIALLQNNHKKYLFICGVATGFALLSKYTANLLFVFYPLIFLLHTLYQDTHTTIKHYITNILTITLLAWSTFAVFMPAVIQKPAHFLYGTIYSPVFSALVNPLISLTHTQNFFFTVDHTYKTIPLGIASLGIFAMCIISFPIIVLWITQKFPTIIKTILNIIAGFFLLAVTLSLINVWDNELFFSLTNIKESTQGTDSIAFAQLTHYPKALWLFFGLIIQMQNSIFSLHPIVLALLLCGIGMLFTRQKIVYRYMYYLPFLMLYIFIVGGTLANIFVNVRYGIMLYVPFTITAAIICAQYTQRWTCRMRVVLYCGIVLLHIFSLWTITPFYFNYENALLPKKYTVTDAWGYGVYEAAAFLNAQPHARDLIIWSDRDGVCQFFVGKCISPHIIDLNHTHVDYFVFSRRGLQRKQFTTKAHAETGYNINRTQYTSPTALQNPTWELHIGNRPHNFTKIMAVSPQSTLQ